MGAISKIDALTALANGQLVGFHYKDQPDIEVVIDKSWSIDRILGLDSDLYIKIEEIHLNGMVFLKPYSLEELIDGQEVFIVENFSRVTQCTFNAKDERHVLTAKSGFVQRDRKNAGIQAEAIQSVLGFQSVVYIQKDDGKRSKAKPVQMTVEPLNAKETTIDSLNTTREVKAEINSKTAKITAEQPKDTISIEAKLDFQLTTLKLCTTVEEVNSILLDANTIGFNAEQMLEINMLSEKKIADIQGAVIDESESTEVTAERINNANYEKLLADLIDSAQKASTPTEANALYKHTASWTQEQRKPLMDAITKRLQEINQPEKSESSLMVRINNATTIIDLMKLEEEILTCDPKIQDRLTDYANQRRTDLNNSADKPWELQA